MSNQLLSAKIAIIEEQPTVRPIQGATQSDTAMVGITERGPFGPNLVQSFPEYKKLYGGFTANSDAALAAQAFFDNGGINLWVARTVHYSDITDGTTKTSAAGTVMLLTGNLAATPGTETASIVGPYVLAAADTLITKIDGGGNLTTTFNATAAVRTSGNGTYALSDGQTLTLSIDGGATQTFTFHTSNFVSIGAATATEVAAVIAATLSGAVASVSGSAVRITSSKLGTASGVNVTGGSANGALSFPTGNTAGTGNVANIAAVTTSEVVSLLATALGGAASVAAVGGAPKVTSATTGTSSSVQFTSGGTAQSKIGFDTAIHSGVATGAQNTLQVNGKTDGAYANALSIQIADPTNGLANYFNLLVLKGSSVVENWPNVTMDNTITADYVVNKINATNGGSDYIAVVDENSTAGSPNDRPVDGTFAMAGGNDGLSGLVDGDFSGNSAGATGMHAFDTVSALRILIVPARATSAVHNAMLTYCETFRFGSMFAILDPPAQQTAVQMNTYVVSTAALKESSEFGAIYWPRVKISNPSTDIFGTGATITVAPSGAIAGLYGRNDASKPGGIYEAPAGIDFGRLLNVIGLETIGSAPRSEVYDENKRDLVFPNLINPIVGIDGLPIHVDGARCLKSTSNFPTIGERRGVIYIEQSLKNGLIFAKHRKIKNRLFAELLRSVNAFLRLQLRNDAFASDDPKLAYAVDFSGAINPPSEAFVRRVNGRIGLATAKPAEFIVLRVGQDTRALEEELAAAA